METYDKIPHVLTYLESEYNEKSAPVSLGVPEFEVITILSLVKNNPGLDKKQLITKIMALFNYSESFDRVYSKYIDILVELNQLARYDFKYYLIPAGIQRLTELKAKLNAAIIYVAHEYEK